MDSRRLEHFKRELEDAKVRLTDEISRLEKTGIGDTMAYSLGELSMYDNHPADIGDELFERSKDVALRDNAHILLEQVEVAQAKIAEGTYGKCIKCGRPIDPARLEAVPWTTHCIECQISEETIEPNPRPLEEEVLAPPFHRTFLDTAYFDNVGFDGEDALQAVLRWGSSDSPQDLPGSYDYKALWPNSNEHQGIVSLADAIPAATEVENTARKKQASEKTEQL